MAKLSEITQDSDFLSLSPSGQREIRTRYFRKNIAQDPDFLSLSDQGKADIMQRTFGGTPQEIVSVPLLPEEQAEIDKEEFTSRLNLDISQRIEKAKGTAKQDLGSLSAIDLLLLLPETPVISPGDRKRITRLLEQKGVPKDSIFEFLRASDETGGLEKFIQEEAVPLTFEMAGGATGLAAGGALGGVAGTVIGAGLGEAAQFGIEKRFFPERLGPLKEELKESAFDVGIAGLTEVGVGALLAPLRGGGRNIRKGASVFADELQDAGQRIAPDILDRLETAFGPLTKDQVSLLASERSAAPILASIDNIVSKSLIGQADFATSLRKKIGAFQQLTRETIDGIAGNLRTLDPTQMAVAFKDSVDGSKTAFKSVWQKAYSQVDDAVAKTAKPIVKPVQRATNIIGADGKPLTRLATEVVREAGDAVNVRTAKKTGQEFLDLVKEGRRLPLVSDEGQAFTRLIGGLRDDMTFLDAQINASDLHKIANQFDKSGRTRARDIANRMANQITSSQETAARKAGGDVLATWQFANDSFEEGFELWDSAVIRQLGRDIADSPLATAKTIFSGKDPVTNVRKVKKILLGKQGKTAGQVAEDKKAWNLLQRSYLEKIVKDGSDIDKFLIGQNFGDILVQQEDLIIETFGKEHFNTLRKISDRGRLIQTRLQGEGGLIVRLLEAPAIAGAVTGVERGKALVTLFGAGQLSSILTNPKAAKRLAEGLLVLGKSGETGTKATAKLTRELLLASSQFRKDKAEEARIRKRNRTRMLAKEFRRQTPTAGQLRGFGGRGF